MGRDDRPEREMGMSYGRRVKLRMRRVVLMKREEQSYIISNVAQLYSVLDRITYRTTSGEL